MQMFAHFLRFEASSCLCLGSPLSLRQRKGLKDDGEEGDGRGLSGRAITFPIGMIDERCGRGFFSSKISIDFLKESVNYAASPHQHSPYEKTKEFVMEEWSTFTTFTGVANYNNRI